MQEQIRKFLTSDVEIKQIFLCIFNISVLRKPANCSDALSMPTINESTGMR